MVSLPLVERYARIPALTRTQFLDTMLVLINAEVADAACGVIDGIVVGRFLGEEAIAAHGIASPIFIILSIFCYIISVGFQQPCTMYIGRGEMRRANGLFSATLLLTLGIAGVIVLGGLLFPHGITRLMGAPSGGAIHDMAGDYLQAIFLGTPSLMVFLALIPVLQLDGQRRLVHLGSLVMAVSDVVIDLLNVTVFHGGMWGMGMATSISYTLGLLVLLSYFLRKNRLFHFRIGDISGSNPGRIFTTGYPAGVRVGARAIAVVLLNSYVLGIMGASAMAALSVQHNLSSLLLSVAIGISETVLLLTDISYGEQDRRGLMDIVRMGAYASIGVVGLVSIAVFSLAQPLVSLYLGPQEASFTLAVRAVRYLAVSMPLMAWVRCMGCYLQGVEQQLRAVLVFLCEELLFLVPCALVMSRFWGAEGIFAAFPVSQILLIGVINVVAYLRRDRRYKGMEAYLFVPDGFGTAPEDRLERTLETPEAVWALAEEAQTFCQERGLPPEKAYWVSMYIEEMGNINMIYGFADGKPHHLEVRLSLYQGSAILRFRDDCRRFDITERASHWQEDPEHPETTLAVRMVISACKQMTYSNSLNTNNLMVVL